MTELITIVIASYALWSIIGTTDFPVLYRVRDALMSKSVTFTKFIYCPLCSGFWSSVIVSLLLGHTKPSVLFLHGLFGAGSIFLIEKHVSRIDGER